MNNFLSQSLLPKKVFEGKVVSIINQLNPYHENQDSKSSNR